MKRAEQILDFQLDPIPEYVLLHDVLELDKDTDKMKEAKEKVLASEMVSEIIDEQWSDGSWGKFHSMAELRQSSITTEQAIRRLIAFGLDKDDEVLHRALTYMEFFLLEELELRDYKEKKYDWDLLTKSFVATWIKILDPGNVLAKEIAEKWGKIIGHAFSGDKFSQKDYQEAYYDVHKSPQDKEIWDFKNFYVVSLLSDLLPKDIEIKFLDYIINSEDGIYYICDECLNQFPDDFHSKTATRIINAYDVISNYKHSKPLMKDFLRWLYDNICRDGFWDMGQKSKDMIHLPLSETWRKPINRKIDCTVRLHRILTRLGL
ncbi:MAG: hypothetical protein ACOCRK_09890 [bacterium]